MLTDEQDAMHLSLENARQKGFYRLDLYCRVWLFDQDRAYGSCSGVRLLRDTSYGELRSPNLQGGSCRI